MWLVFKGCVLIKIYINFLNQRLIYWIMAKKSRFWNKKTWIGILIVAIMVSSSAGFIFGRDDSGSYKYNGYKFSRTTDGWLGKIDGNSVYFHFHPSELENLSISEEVISKLDVTQAHLTFEIGKNLQYIDMIRFEFITAMEDNFGVYVYSGVINETESYDLPIIDCVNATSDVPVIKFTFANETQVYVDGDCIIAEASSEIEFLAIADKILYKLFGVM